MGLLRFPDEFVRHKVLDLVGDLALLGKQLLGRVVADRAGQRHAYRAGFSFAPRQDALEEVTLPEEESDSPASYGAQASAGSAL